MPRTKYIDHKLHYPEDKYTRTTWTLRFLDTVIYHINRAIIY